VLALRVAGSTDALFLAAGAYLATAVVAPAQGIRTGESHTSPQDIAAVACEGVSPIHGE
jgi:hypothetical protein